MGPANWSEVAQKVRAHERSWVLVRSLLASYEITVEPVTLADAEWAAGRWTQGESLSLADRLCLALGERLDADVLTADGSWGSTGTGPPDSLNPAAIVAPRPTRGGQVTPEAVAAVSAADGGPDCGSRTPADRSR